MPIKFSLYLEVSRCGSLSTRKGRYADLLYERTQKIGDASAFLGVDGIIAPSARRETV